MMDVTEAGKPSGNGHNLSLGIFYGAGAGALWGLVFLAPELVRQFSPLQLATGRYLAYGCMAVIMIAPRWRIIVNYLSRSDWLNLFWLSLFGNTLYYVMLSLAVQQGGIALTSLIIGFLPVAVTIIGSRDKDAIPIIHLLPSLLCCAAGAVCIGWQALFAEKASSQTVIGLFCAIAALASWTAYAVGNSRCLMRLSAISAYDWNLATGVVTGAQAVILIPFAFLLGNLQHSVRQWEFFAATSMAIAVLASIIGNSLWNRMNRLVPLTMAGQMILFETLFALIYGFLWEARWPSPLEIASFVFISLSVMTCVSTHQQHAARQQAKAQTC